MLRCFEARGPTAYVDDTLKWDRALDPKRLTTDLLLFE